MDFRSPKAFFNDIINVAILLKQFLEELPDPLLTKAKYQSFIEAARELESAPMRAEMWVFDC